MFKLSTPGTNSDGENLVVDATETTGISFSYIQIIRQNRSSSQRDRRILCTTFLFKRNVP